MNEVTPKILVVDDEPELRDYLKSALEADGFLVETSADGKSVAKKLKSFEPSCVLLDIGLPDMSGHAVISSVRATSSVPIIMVTGFSSEDDKVAALELGADDYLVKPIQVKELKARIRAVLRRAEQQSQAPSASKILAYRDLAIDETQHEVRLQNELIKLTLTEFRILTELVRRVGRVVSRDELRSGALGNMDVADRTIDVHMASLRKKLGSVLSSLETVPGVGFRLNLEA